MEQQEKKKQLIKPIQISDSIKKLYAESTVFPLLEESKRNVRIFTFNEADIYGGSRVNEEGVSDE